RDEALALPTEESARIALRTQQIIAAESGVPNTVDPVAGSYAIEVLTNEIEQGAAALLDRIDRAGGTLTAIETGLIQREIQESAYQAQLAVDAGDAAVVGVNRFSDQKRESEGVGPGESGHTPDPGPQLLLFGTDPETERLQIERVRAVRASRSASAWR